MTERRRDGRTKFLMLGGFIAVFLFTLLALGSRNIEKDVGAASLAEFDPGYIISDYQMGRYDAMSEAEIQAFLTSKNSCANTNYAYYLALSANKNYTWHFENGHFVCLSEELFGDGEVIGSGETAAHIIWQAAQDYKINPQVLIVLLQKETGLITDPIPNNGDYRKATGYGCPDTAPCSSQYYGFKNQVRKAAALFRTVLDGGWTNYPLGENYVQYNPSSSCGGSTVNIRSLATSALYRYTPYQPNASALAAGYGYGDGCSAYGNRNFYLYFEDWFGGVKSEGKLKGDFDKMLVARILFVKKGARYISPDSGDVGVRQFSNFEYFTHLNYFNDQLCLSLGDNKNCYLYSDLAEISAGNYEEMMQARMLIVENDTRYFDINNKTFEDEISAGEKIIFDKKIYLNDQLCLQPRDGSFGQCILYSDLQELPEYKMRDMLIPRYMYVKKGAKNINLETGLSMAADDDKKIYFNKMDYWFGELCLQEEVDNGTGLCILYDDLVELKDGDFEDMAVARFIKIREGAKVIDATSGKTIKVVENESVKFFNERINLGEELCIQAADKSLTDIGQCIKYSELDEVEGISKMSVPRYISVKRNIKYYDIIEQKYNGGVTPEKMYFENKIYIDGELCLIANDDVKKDLYRCIFYSGLEE